MYKIGDRVAIEQEDCIALVVGVTDRSILVQFPPEMDGVGWTLDEGEPRIARERIEEGLLTLEETQEERYWWYNKRERGMDIVGNRIVWID